MYYVDCMMHMLLSFMPLLNNVYIHVDVSMPPIIRKRGRPKGAEVTVIGLPCKKVCRGAAKQLAKKPRVVPFLKLHSSVKEKGENKRRHLYRCNKSRCSLIHNLCNLATWQKHNLLVKGLKIIQFSAFLPFHQ